MQQDKLTLEEIKEWRDHPVTKTILGKAREYATYHLDMAPYLSDRDDQVAKCDQVHGMRMLLSFIEDYTGEEAV